MALAIAVAALAHSAAQHSSREDERIGRKGGWSVVIFCTCLGGFLAAYTWLPVWACWPGETPSSCESVMDMSALWQRVGVSSGALGVLVPWVLFPVQIFSGRDSHARERSYRRRAADRRARLAELMVKLPVGYLPTLGNGDDGVRLRGGLREKAALRVVFGLILTIGTIVTQGVVGSSTMESVVLAVAAVGLLWISVEILRLGHDSWRHGRRELFASATPGWVNRTLGCLLIASSALLLLVLLLVASRWGVGMVLWMLVVSALGWRVSLCSSVWRDESSLRLEWESLDRLRWTEGATAKAPHARRDQIAS